MVSMRSVAINTCKIFTKLFYRFEIFKMRYRSLKAVFLVAKYLKASAFNCNIVYFFSPNWSNLWNISRSCNLPLTLIASSPHHWVSREVRNNNYKILTPDYTTTLLHYYTVLTHITLLVHIFLPLRWHTNINPLHQSGWSNLFNQAHHHQNIFQMVFKSPSSLACERN